MPGRSWVAGIDIAKVALLAELRPAWSEAEGLPEREDERRRRGPKEQILYELREFGNSGWLRNFTRLPQTARMSGYESNHKLNE